MKILARLALVTILAFAPLAAGSTTTEAITADAYRAAPCGKGRLCRTVKGRDLYVGPKGGCFYCNSNGNKTYVDRSLCDRC